MHSPDPVPILPCSWDSQFEAARRSFNWTFSNIVRAVGSNAGKVQRLIETESFKPLSLSAPRQRDSPRFP